MEKEKREEELKSRFGLYFALGIIVGLIPAIAYVLFNLHMPENYAGAHECRYYYLVPDKNVVAHNLPSYVCYQEVNGLPNVVGVCPTRIGLSFAFYSELNSDVLRSFASGCESVYRKVISSGREVNG